MTEPTVVNINLSTSGRRLGGAAIAAEFHCRYMAELLPLELWRMWDLDEETYLDKLKIINFASRTNFSFLDPILPKRARAFFLESGILDRLMAKRPDIVHLHNPIPSLAFQKIVRKSSQSGIKVVASTHGFYEVMHPNYGLGFTEKILWKYGITRPIVQAIQSLDGVFSLYPEEKKMLVELGVSEDKIHLAPNGVNPLFLTPATPEEKQEVARKFDISSDQPILLFIGNHTANKGLDTVMEVASKLSCPATFVIGGKLLAPDEPQQWQQRFPPNSQVKVVFTDYLTTIEQKALYQLSNVLLFPSLSDTLPLTIIEAMSNNLPVIAYGIGGIAYQLQDDCGKIVAPGDFLGFLQAVEDVISNPIAQAQLAEKAKLRQESIFSWDKTAQMTVDVYRELLK
jgi:alpha-maltose-1-phosphate synthase